LLRALAPVFSGVAFCPTGGIEERSAREYLALPNVPMVRGSWMGAEGGRDRPRLGRVRRLAEPDAAIERPLGS
jgi:2-dehydro-3-deoxyphosphogluconate aldolase / (4S)-4-hydroxy-2-oxoglutarate aldolase